MKNENLPIDVGAGSNADRRNRNRPGYRSGKRARNAFQNDRETSERLEPLRLAQKILRRFFVTTLHAKTAQPMNGLRGEPNMPHDGNARANDRLDPLFMPPNTFQLDGLSTRFDEALDRMKGFAHAATERQKRQIRDQKLALDPP